MVRMKENNSQVVNWVVGSPIEQSMSPLLHTALYKQLDIDATMIAKSYTDSEVLVDDIRRNGVPLTAVTMPLKQSVAAYLDRLEGVASQLGIVNTIINTNGKLFGYNTDMDGISYSLSSQDLNNKSILILGAGAVANLVGLYLSQYTPIIYWHNRTQAKAEKLSQIFGGKIISLNETDDLKIDIIINTTPIGMKSKIGIPIHSKLIHQDQIVFDVIYNPIKTELISTAEYIGAHAITGITMFVVQAIRQIEIWCGKKLLTNNLLNMATETVNRGFHERSLHKK